MAAAFVTGTGTGVGKTFVAAALAAASVAEGLSTKVRKPLLSGLDDPCGDGPPHDHELLSAAVKGTEPPEAIAPLRFGPAVSPHLAAAQAGVTIDADTLIGDIRAASASCERLIVEGAGGWRVPIAGSFGFRELAVELGYPVVIAASAGLGTINHSLMTIESVRAAGLEVRCVVFGPVGSAPSPMETDNIESVATLGEVPVAIIPHIDHRSQPEFASAGLALPLGAIFA